MAQIFLETKKLRTERVHFSAICQYVSEFRKQKIYTSILLNKIDGWLKQRAFRTWVDDSNQSGLQAKVAT